MLTVLAYLVVGIFLVGFAHRIWLYASCPAPLKIPTTPAPVTTSGVVWRLFTEVAFFNSLFKGDKWAWAGSYAFHGALVLVLLRHLRYFVEPLPAFFAHIQIAGIVAGLVMVGGLGLLLLRRVLIDRVRYISSPADYLWLLLLLGIGGSGLLMQFCIRPDIVHIKAAMMGMWSSTEATLPTLMVGDFIFIAHLLMVAALIVLFPFSKLMHLGGIFFSPTRNQVDNPREKRHVNPWASN
ncbi:respiratory nitrate reductase subunit gamma [Candidatus Magnetaquicoccus inordinatus]|uniref:respiratory nitrate reductase subunit gamma n=1 Tax=Candidatus Magnetaquicoccus inordinatus TaxID=2496818 RepID=UPI00102B839A|nr:respiratory nitrate reductase subunit gamma [Candidatus Magnetaquicoccus inordinatus]